MEFRVLKYFLTVAQEENITRAADVLHMSQPALSRQLIQLEEELGVRLFRRGRHSTSLTEDGILFRRRAEEIVGLAERTEREFRSGADSVSGTVAIGSGEAETMRTLASILKEFGEKYPRVRFELYSNNADFIRERLEQGTLDIGVLLGRVDLTKYESIRLPGRERWGVLLPAASPLAAQPSVGPQDLVGKKILLANRGLSQGVADWLGEYRERLDVYITYNLAYNAAMLVESGLGAAVCIEGSVSLYKNPNIVFRPFFPEVSVTSVMVWKARSPMPRAVEAFLAFAKEKLAEAEKREKEE